MFDYLLLAALGLLMGVFTGLTPGLHVNTVCLIGLGVYAGLGLDPVQFCVFMVAMSVTHTFLDFIPSIFIGVPDEGTALSVLPTHQLVMEGKGLEAVKLTGYGCLLGLVFSVLLLLPAVYILPIIYQGIRGFVAYVIGSAAALLVLRERGWPRRVWALAIFLLSGLLGMSVLELPGISSSDVLFPVFAGMFGLSGILYSLNERQRIVPQRGYAKVRVDREIWTGGFFGALGGMAVGVLPAMSPAQVGILLSELFGSTRRAFIVSVAAIGTSDSIYSIVSLYTLHNPRSGVAVMISRIMEVDPPTMLLFVGVFSLVAFAALRIHIEIGKRSAACVNAIDYRILSVSVLLFVTALIWFMTGLFGLIIAAASTAIGLLPILSGVSRTHLMGVLIIPTIMYFTGLV
jgi:putative membrane protein